MKKHTYIIALALIVTILVGVNVMLLKIGMNSAISEAGKSYKKTKEKTEEEIARKCYAWAFQRAEEEYHVSNEVTISLEDIRELSELEVLCVSDVEFVTKNAEDNQEKVTAWMSIPGNGVFTVNMQTSEFIVDSERHIVVARLPEPSLKRFKVDYENIQIYEFEKGSFGNGNYSEGEALADSHVKEGEQMLRTEFLSNQWYIQKAEESAQKLITELVRKLNPDVEDLKVVVEFVAY